MPTDDGTILVHQGVQLNVVFDVVDVAGAPVTLAGYEAAMQVRPRPGDPELLLDLSTANGTITIEPSGATGVVAVQAGGDLTAAMAKGGKYDCLAWPSGNTSAALLIAEGSVVLRKRVTEQP